MPVSLYHDRHSGVQRKMALASSALLCFVLIAVAGCTTPRSHQSRIVRHQGAGTAPLPDYQKAQKTDYKESGSDNRKLTHAPSSTKTDDAVTTISTDRIGMKDAVGIALARHPDIGRANAIVAQSKVQIAIEKAAWYPTFQYSLNPGYNRYYNSGNNNNDAGNVRGTVGASQLIYDFGRTSSRIGAAQATTKNRPIN